MRYMVTAILLAGLVAGMIYGCEKGDSTSNQALEAHATHGLEARATRDAHAAPHVPRYTHRAESLSQMVIADRPGSSGLMRCQR